MSLGDLSRGGPPRRGGSRRLGLLAAVAAAVVVLFVAVSALGGDDEPPADDDPSTTAGDTSSTDSTAAGDDGADSAGGFDFGSGPCPPAEKPSPPVRQFTDAPQRCTTDGVDYTAVIDTNLGAITVDLLEDDAPGTVNNFVVLARHAYFDGLTFHRIIPGFVAQGGDPRGDGTGDPGYTIPDELPGGTGRSYEVGSVAMANSFDRSSGRGRDTGGSQFFIVTGANGVSLPPDYPLFGQVTAGADVVAQIEARGSQGGAPTEPVVINWVEIVEQPAPAPAG